MDKYQLDLYTDYLMVTFGYSVYCLYKVQGFGKSATLHSRNNYIIFRLDKLQQY